MPAPAHRVVFPKMFTRKRRVKVPSAATADMGPKVVWGANIRRNVQGPLWEGEVRCVIHESPPPWPTTPNTPQATVEKAW